MNDSRGSEWSGRPAGSRSRITELLSESANGRRSAFDEIISLVYDDLKRIAHRRLQSDRTGGTLDTSAVVHEAYVQLVERSDTDWRNRAHFFAVAARVIRSVVVDHARQRAALKRGGDVIRVALRDDLHGRDPEIVNLLVVDEALKRLASHDARLERVVECRFFAGMSVQETAEVLGVSVRTVERDWTRARAYLYDALDDGSGADGHPAGS